MKGVHLSVVIPVFNEASRISDSVGKVVAFLKAQPYASEIIISDDGSTDSTVQVAKSRIGDFPHKIFQSSINRGKGHAVKQGMLAGEGLYLLFTDADLSTPIEEVTRFIDLIEKEGYDCIIGSRAHPESRIEIHQNPLRELMGKIFNRFARLLSFHGISDSQCGFKCFKREVARDLFSRQKTEGFSFDVEILYLAQRLGYRILEAPVTWRNSPQSRVKMLRDPFSMFADLLRIRWLHRSLEGGA